MPGIQRIATHRAGGRRHRHVRRLGFLTTSRQGCCRQREALDDTSLGAQALARTSFPATKEALRLPQLEFPTRPTSATECHVPDAISASAPALRTDRPQPALRVLRATQCQRVQLGRGGDGHGGPAPTAFGHSRPKSTAPDESPGLGARPGKDGDLRRRGPGLDADEENYPAAHRQRFHVTLQMGTAPNSVLFCLVGVIGIWFPRGVQNQDDEDCPTRVPEYKCRDLLYKDLTRPIDLKYGGLRRSMKIYTDLP